eukprot:scaffold200553_cov30-Attheya_sp.AAC.1
MSKIIEEGPEWETSTIKRPIRQRLDVPAEVPGAKRLRKGEPTSRTEEVVPDSENHEPASQQEPSVNGEKPQTVKVKPGTHVRTKDWYHEESSEAKVAKEKKAMKSNDAAVPVHLWNARITDELFEPGASPD